MGRLLFKLFLAFFGLVLLLGMLLFLLVYIAWASLRWLITGQKPQVAVVWQRYRIRLPRAPQPGRPTMWWTWKCVKCVPTTTRSSG